MTAYTEANILDTAYRASDDLVLPDIHFGYDAEQCAGDTVLFLRLTAYRNDAHWAILITSIHWSADHGQGITVKVAPIGNCVVPCDPDDDSDRFMNTVELDVDSNVKTLREPKTIQAVRIRGRQVDYSRLKMKPERGIKREKTFWLAAALVEKYHEEILPTQAELARFFPEEMPPKFMELNEWSFPSYGDACDWEVFQMFAEALVTGDPGRYQPTEEPNTDWRVRLQEEEDEEIDERGFLKLPNREQSKEIDEIVAVWKAKASCTDPIDRNACIVAFSALYAAMGLPAPEFVFCTSLLDMRERAAAMAAEAPEFEQLAGEKLFPFVDDNEVGSRIHIPQMRGISRYVSEALAPFFEISESQDAAERKSGSARMKEWMPYRMSTSIWRAVDSIVESHAAEKLGLHQAQQVKHLAAQALGACGGVGWYERYCFISERPVRIVHPGITHGAPKGRCRIVWCDGFVCDEKL